MPFSSHLAGFKALLVVRDQSGRPTPYQPWPDTLFTQSLSARKLTFNKVDQIAKSRIRHKRTSVILTGRNAKEELMDYADLVTEMKEIKHPFKNAGIKAQRGIDF